jgi:hypothetical protein
MTFRKFLFVVTIFFCTSMQAIAQDTLPNFTVRELAKGKVQVSWINPFDNVVQMIVQRSYDSTKYFRSIFSSQSPWLPQNGFVDNNVAKGYKVFYRVQYVFEGGEYFFTKSKSPDNYVPVKVIRVNNDEPEDAVDSSNNKETSDNKDSKATEKKPTRYIKVYKVNKDTLVATIEYKDYKRYRDSIMKTTKDTLQRTYDDEVIIKPYVPKPVWKASTYIFSNERGFIRVIIPNIKQHKYRVIFFEDTMEELFQIKQVKEADLVLDKSNFYKSGWYYFELYEDEKLIEKNKFFVGKDR